MNDNTNDVSIKYRTIYDNVGEKEAIKGLENVQNKGEEMSDKLSSAFGAVKWAVLGDAIKKVVGKIAEVTKVSADYIETLNVLQVAFDGNTESIRRFSSQLSDVLNLDDSTVLKSAAHFKVLSQSMGMATATGEKLAKLMTQMTLDVSSLYNMDFEKAQRALQYAMEGRGTSLKQRTGVSVLETSVQTTLDVLGIDAYVEDMNDAEKAIARVISMEYQLMSSQGDLARTIEAPANQMRVMGEQVQMLARNIGNVLLPIVAKILPYLNAILIVLNAIISALARLVGYKEDMFDTFEDSNTIDYFDGVGAAIDGVGNSAAKAAKQLQGLRGFDKLNVIRTPSSGGGSGGGAGGGVGGINPNLLKAFNAMADQYKMKLEGVKTKATEIAEKILKWLGFAKKINKETGKTEWYFKRLTGGTLIGAFGTGGVILLGLNKILKLLNKIGLIKYDGLTSLVKLFKDGAIAQSITKVSSALGISSGALAGIAAAVLIVVAAFIRAYTTIDEFKEKVDSAFSSVSKLITTIQEKLAPILTPLFSIFSEAVKIGWETIEMYLGYLYDGFVATFSAIADTIDGTAKIITDLINGDYNKAIEDLKTMIHNLKEDWDKYWEKIGKRFSDWKDDLLKKAEDFIDKAKKKLQELPDKLDKFPEKAGEAIGKMIKTIDEKIRNTDWKKVGKYIIENILTPLVVWEWDILWKILNFPNKVAEKISEAIRNADWYSIGQNILNGILNGMFGFNAKLYDWAAKFANGIKKGLGIASPSKLMLRMKIGDYTLQGITLGMEREMDLVEKEAESIANTIQDGMKKAASDAKVTATVAPIMDDLVLNGIVNSGVAEGLNNGSFVANQSQLSKDIASNSKGLNNATFIVQVGNKEIAKQIITDLQDMAKDNGKPIMIGG